MIPVGLSEVDTGLIALVLGGSGIGGVYVAFRKVGPERIATVVGYQGEIIEDLVAENTRIRTENSRILAENENLKQQVASLLKRVTVLEDRLP